MPISSRWNSIIFSEINTYNVCKISDIQQDQVSMIKPRIQSGCLLYYKVVQVCSNTGIGIFMYRPKYTNIKIPIPVEQTRTNYKDIIMINTLNTINNIFHVRLDCIYIYIRNLATHVPVLGRRRSLRRTIFTGDIFVRFHMISAIFNTCHVTFRGTSSGHMIGKMETVGKILVLVLSFICVHSVSSTVWPVPYKWVSN